LVGAGLDTLVGDPRRAHPVAAFGRTVGALERRAWADSRWRGTWFTTGCVVAVGALGLAAQTAVRSTTGRVALTAVATWAVLGGTTLRREGRNMAGLLQGGDVPAARSALGSLCGRDATALGGPDLARATVESIAENTSDAVVAPLLWGAVAGLPGLLVYRAVNTLDAMIGHRSPRHERFGWAAARLDDAANLAPARLTGLLAAGLAPTVGGSPVRALRVLRRDGGAHPSPNAGRCEAAFAGALGVRLGGVNRYGDRLERRDPLGDGPAPEAEDIARAVRLCRAVGLAALGLAAATAWRLETRGAGR
jgi:adenosylcobinamide-phosphate synthase